MIADWRTLDVTSIKIAGWRTLDVSGIPEASVKAATASLTAPMGADGDGAVQASAWRSAPAAGVGPAMATAMTMDILASTPTHPALSAWDTAAAAPAAAAPVGVGDKLIK